MKLLFIDLETTGINSSSSIIHLYAILRENGKIKERIDIRMNPCQGDRLEFNADYNNGHRTVSQLEGYEQFTGFLKKFINPYDKEDKAHMVAYNIAFENDHLRRFFRRNDDRWFGSWFFTPGICVMQMASYYFRTNRKELPNFKQMTVAQKLGIEVDETKLHNAEYDVEILKSIYNELDKRNRRSTRKRGITEEMQKRRERNRLRRRVRCKCGKCK